MSRIFIILSVFLLASCSETLDIQLEQNVDVYFSDSEKVTPLTANDEAYQELNQWLRDNNSSWYQTSGRYPGGVYIKSGSDGIQITRTQVVIYSTSTPEPQAIYIQKFDGGELTTIRNLGK